MARWTAFCFAVSAQLCICYEIERIENWKLQLSRFTNFRAWLGSILNSFIAEQILDDIIHFIIGIYISKMQTFHHKKKIISVTWKSTIYMNLDADWLFFWSCKSLLCSPLW